MSVGRRLSLVLLPIGPLIVAFLRLVLPYYTAPDSAATVAAVAAHPDAQSLVLWLGLAALLTMVPGIVVLLQELPRSWPKTVGATLALAGYLCLGTLLVSDQLVWAGVTAGVDARQVAAMLDALHPSYAVGVVIFVAGHVIGTVLLGVALLRWRTVPGWAAWAVIVSQPIHLVAYVFLGSPVLDFVGYLLMTTGLAVTSFTLLTASPARAATPAQVG